MLHLLGRFVFLAATLSVVMINSIAPVASSASFKVAEVKPHHGCKTSDGQERVRQYISNLANEQFGLITLLEMEFTLPQLAGYTAFGAACGHYSDPAVVLVNEQQFSIISTMGATLSGNFSQMPYLGREQVAPGPAANQCVSDPMAKFGPGHWAQVGSRPYSGAVLLHKDTGREICMVAATFAHCLYEWTNQFIEDVEKTCGSRQLVIVADTNAGCEVPTVKSNSHWHFDDILANHSKASWGPCHDPGIYAPPTCCNDFPPWPYARFQYDRTVSCNAGRISDFQVEETFVCADSPEEHLFTKAVVHLGEPEYAQSASCLDHTHCAKQGFVYDPNDKMNMVLPADGLCCPSGKSKRSLPCCNSSVVEVQV